MVVDSGVSVGVELGDNSTVGDAEGLGSGKGVADELAGAGSGEEDVSGACPVTSPGENGTGVTSGWGVGSGVIEGDEAGDAETTGEVAGVGVGSGVADELAGAGSGVGVGVSSGITGL